MSFSPRLFVTSPDRRTASRRGSALIVVSIISTVLVLLLGSLLSYAMSERRLNSRHVARIEARNAAEALVEYGASQIRQKYETRGTFTLNPNGTDALRQPPTSFWSGTRVVTTQSDLTGSNKPPVTSLDLELVGGTERRVTTGTSSLYFVDPTDENNADDPLLGKWVTRRDISVIARATVQPTSGGRPISAYVGQTISIRGAPLFAHAIFYNMDLEIFPGPAMNITGPVHTNGNLYLYPENSLNFRGNVTATGKIYKAGKPGDTQDGTTASGRSGSINFLNRAGNLVNLYGKDLTRPSGSPGSDFWRDSTGGTGTSGTSFANFAANASQAWNGYLQTGEHGIQNYTPVAIGKYFEDPTPTNGVDNSVNTGRLIIEPPAIPNTTDPAYDLKIEVEKQKYANMAGIYITVEPTTGTITLQSRGLTSSNELKTPKTLTLPTNNELVQFKPYRETAVTETVVNVYGLREQQGNSSNRTYRYPIITSTKTVSTTVKTNSATGGTSSNTTTAAPVVTTGEYTAWSSNSSAPALTSTTTSYSVSSGMYDHHRAKGIDLVEIDIDALRDVVTEMQKTSGVDPAKAIGNLTADDWNGIVYIDVLGGPTTRVVDESTSLLAGSTVDPTNLANNKTSVRLINGTGRVPSFGTANPGLTIATNSSLYVKGHFNADGNTSTSGGVNPSTDAESGEVPAAIAADAITVLSPSFNDASSRGTVNPAASSGGVEIAAAFLMGIAPTNKNGNGKTSGGAHNVVRFLENWGSKNTWFRGSLVCLFESRIFTEPHGSGYYGAPNRNWGFNELYGDGLYPPGTPRVLSPRRVNFTHLTAAEYERVRDSFNW